MRKTREKLRTLFLRKDKKSQFPAYKALASQKTGFIIFPTF
jgi:hypothetical protein